MTGSGGAALGTGGNVEGGGGSRGMDAQGGAAGQGGNGGSIGSGGSGGSGGYSDAGDAADAADAGDVAGAGDAANDAPVGGAGPDDVAHDVPSSADASVELSPDAALDGQAFLDASTTWCQASTHLFCADFDGEPYTANWSDQIAIGFGKTSRTTALSKSAPAAFLSAITTPPRAGSVTLTVDGTTIVSSGNSIDADYYAATSTATVLSIGLSTIGTQELIMSATFDNVTFDIAP